ncbi:MAG: hypothetical protein SXQ77_05180 [Halobacteria archaeon]|nr:hypothetical protein [Halobacteria archaeon]
MTSSSDENPDGGYVRVADSGNSARYHRPEAGDAPDDSEEITKKQAINRGVLPCPDCFPEEAENPPHTSDETLVIKNENVDENPEAGEIWNVSARELLKLLRSLGSLWIVSQDEPDTVEDIAEKIEREPEEVEASLETLRDYDLVYFEGEYFEPERGIRPRPRYSGIEFVVRESEGEGEGEGEDEDEREE